ncbi:MAG: MaoC/PaaZ C-terminal domain-containing protein, partial [Pseudomonadota bacterium]
ELVASRGDVSTELAAPGLVRVEQELDSVNARLHTDIDFARESAGLEDVIGHGMLTMAMIGQMIDETFPRESISEFGVRFVAPSRVGDAITCALEPETDGDGRTWAVSAVTADGRTLAEGRLVVTSMNKS